MILLDTHAFIWLLLEPERLSKAARDAIDEALVSGGLAIADISLWEIAMLVQKGRIVIHGLLKHWLSQAINASSVVTIGIDAEIAVQSVSLQNFHGDPADRLIVATAQAKALPLITKDERILSCCHIRTVW